MANIRLYQFPTKASPVAADIVYLGDSANSFDEVQSTIAEFANAIQSMSGLSGNLQAPSGIASGNQPVLTFTYQASAVNFFNMQSTPTLNGPQLNAAGTDSSVPINIGPKDSYLAIYDVAATVGGQMRLYNAAYSTYTGFKKADAGATSVVFTVHVRQFAAAGLGQMLCHKVHHSHLVSTVEGI